MKAPGQMRGGEADGTCVSSTRNEWRKELAVPISEDALWIRPDLDNEGTCMSHAM